MTTRATAKGDDEYMRELLREIRENAEKLSELAGDEVGIVTKAIEIIEHCDEMTPLLMPANKRKRGSR